MLILAPGCSKNGLLQLDAARVLVASNLGDRWIFLFGFEKNKRANVSDQELKVLQVMGPTFLNWSTAELATALQEDHLKEINND